MPDLIQPPHTAHYTQGYYVRRHGEWRPLDSVRLAHTIGPVTDDATLLESIVYIGAKGDCAIARAGMKTDGGSKPWWSWILVGHPWEDYLPCYVVHDSECDAARFLLETEAIDVDLARAMRKKADRRFLEGMRWLSTQSASGARGWWGRIARRLQYRAVRCNALATIRRRPPYDD